MATARELVRQLGRETNEPWVYDSRTRGARNLATGETIARRQLERRPGGRLAEEGFRSYEAKAKARRAQGLKGYRQVRPGIFEKTITDKRERKHALEALPQQRSFVKVLVQGDDPIGRYPGDGRRTHGVWRTMNFAKRAGKAAWMTPEDILSVWDSRASKAGKVIERPRRWVIRVTIPS